MLRRFGALVLAFHVLAASLPVRVGFAPAEPAAVADEAACAGPSCPCHPEEAQPCCCAPTEPVELAGGLFLKAGSCMPRSAVVLIENPGVPAPAVAPEIDLEQSPLGRVEPVETRLASQEPSPPVPPPRLRA